MDQQVGVTEMRVIWKKAVKRWYVFVVALAVSLSVAYAYLQVAQPMYQVEAQVLIKDEKSYGEDILFAELGLGKKVKNLENEVLVLLSSPLMADVVYKNSLQYRYFRDQGPVLKEVYLNPPIRILDWTPVSSRGRVTGEVVVEEDGWYRFMVDGKEYAGEFGSRLELPEGKLILWSDRTLAPGEGLVIMALSVPEMVGFFRENLEVTIAGEESSTLVLRLKDLSPHRAHDALMGLVEAYNKHTIDEKNKGYEGAIRLINERLDMVGRELSEVEMDVEVFKRVSGTVELSAEGSLLMSELATFDHRISDLEVQLDVMRSIEEVLQKNVDGRDFVPTNLSINNVTLNTELQSFNGLVAERERLERKLGPDHPDLLLLSKQINNLRKSILDNIKAIKAEINLMRAASLEQRQIKASRTRSLPRRERELVEKTRRKGVVENLYLYLLQKREESAISMAVTTSTGTVVEPADIPEVPVSPKRAQIWLISMFLGLAVPGIIIILMDRFNDKIEEAADIQKMTAVPILGVIGETRSKEKMVAQQKGTSVIAEMFRLLRADLLYLTPGEDLKVLLVTSSASGEGKSFICMNLGMTMALVGKKVIIVELDLRRPRQERYFGMGESGTGIVNYLVDVSKGMEDVVVNSGLHPRLDLILAGPIPPDPGELILSKRLRALIAELKGHYDTIILDTPPVGLVADALQLADLTQATMYIVRSGYTRQPQLKVIDDIYTKSKMPKPFIVLNGVRLDRLDPYGGYGYGSDYVSEEEPKGLKGWWSRVTGPRGKQGAPVQGHGVSP